jgi:hypothetical protein
MPSDGFTKALPRQKVNAFIEQLEMVDIENLLTTIPEALA